jgi:hypothetical protein
MKTYIEKYKGIHPGIILERELKKRALHQRTFALSIGGISANAKCHY